MISKQTFDILFIVIATGILLLLYTYNLLEEYVAFALVPILVAYRLGQYSEKKFKK